MLANIKESLVRNITNAAGWRTNRKIIVLESDDWGMVRMASSTAFKRLQRKGYPVDRCPYNRNDSLASNADMERLMEVLDSVRDRNGNPPVMTANNIVANPDFRKIREDSFDRYHYEPYTVTLERYPDHDRTFALQKEAFELGLFHPQLHGREHLHVPHWLEALQTGERRVLDAFDEGMFTVRNDGRSSCRTEYLDGFGMYDPQQVAELEKVIREAADLFSEIWGTRSQSVIAPCYTWRPEVEYFFHLCGISYIQSGRVQRVPQSRFGKMKFVRHYLGQRTKHGLRYLLRNALFEPSANPELDWVNSCLNEIKNAFWWGKPAIISTHRVNYIGFINPANSDRNLPLLRDLLHKIVLAWPEVEFMSSDRLGRMIAS